jgi:predicted transport protein
MKAGWACPRCKRCFTRANQRHACGTSDGKGITRGRSPELIALYEALRTFALALGSVEVVERERYALFRSHRIFADLTVMTDALRLVIHLPDRLDDERFIKVAADRRQVSHVIKLQTRSELEDVQPWLRSAHAFARASR